MFATPAFAQAAGAGGAAGAFTSFVPLILIFAIMYFMLIRPQVRTQGGFVAKVTHVHDDGTLEVEIAPGVKVKVLRHTVAQVMSKTEPASA